MNNVTLTSTIGTGYTSPEYQWQTSTNSGVSWSNLTGQTNSSLVLAPSGVAGTQYRLLAAENGNISLPNARVMSNVATATDSGSCLVAPSVSKAFSPTTISSGGVSQLTITIANTNASAITTSATLTDTLPTGVTVGSGGNTGTCTGVTATAGSSTITMASGTSIAAGGCTIMVNTTSSTTGTHTNTIATGALQTSAGNNPTPATANLTVNNPVADLRLTKTADKTTVRLGDLLTFTLTLTNAGPAAAPDVKVKDLLNSAFTFVSANPSQGTYTAATGIWDLGTVAVGNATLTITVRVN